MHCCKAIKSIAWVVMLTFGFNTVAQAAPMIPSVPVERLIETSLADIIQNPSRIQIPFDHVTLKDVHKGTNGKLIIHIQDAHANPSGQQSLANALDDIMQRYAIPLVLVEGGDRDVTLDEVKTIADQKTWKLMAKRFLHQSIISGEEYLNLVSNHPMRLRGIEYGDLYEKNLKAYAKLKDKRKKVLLYLHRIQTSLDRIKNRLYPKELLDYEEKYKKDKAGEDFVQGFDELLNLAQDSQELSLDDISEVRNLQKIREAEKGIDFNRANEEQQKLLSELSNRGASKLLNKHMKAFKKAKNSQVSQFVLLNNLFSLAEGKGITTKSLKHLWDYYRYLEKFSRLRLDVLFEELELLEDRVYRDLLPDDDAKKIRAIDRFLRLLKHAYSIQMSSREFRMLAVNEPIFSTPSWQALMNEKLKQLGYLEDILTYKPYLEDAKKDLKTFYSLVNQRDSAFMTNTQRILKEQNQDIAFMIAGGYHTEHLTQLMREEGYSYVVLTPMVHYETDQKKYERFLLSELSDTSSPKSPQSKATLVKKSGYVDSNAPTVRFKSLLLARGERRRIMQRTNGRIGPQLVAALKSSKTNRQPNDVGVRPLSRTGLRGDQDAITQSTSLGIKRGTIGARTMVFETGIPPESMKEMLMVFMPLRTMLLRSRRFVSGKTVVREALEDLGSYPSYLEYSRSVDQTIASVWHEILVDRMIIDRIEGEIDLEAILEPLLEQIPPYADQKQDAPEIEAQVRETIIEILDVIIATLSSDEPKLSEEEQFWQYRRLNSVQMGLLEDVYLDYLSIIDRITAADELVAPIHRQLNEAHTSVELWKTYGVSLDSDSAYVEFKGAQYTSDPDQMMLRHNHVWTKGDEQSEQIFKLWWQATGDDFWHDYYEWKLQAQRIAEELIRYHGIQLDSPLNQSPLLYPKTPNYISQARSEFLDAPLPQDHFFNVMMRVAPQMEGYTGANRQDVMTLINDPFCKSYCDPYFRELLQSGKYAEGSGNEKVVIIETLAPLLLRSHGMPESARVRFRRVIGTYIYGGGPQWTQFGNDWDKWAYTSSGKFIVMLREQAAQGGAAGVLGRLATSVDPDIRRFGESMLAKAQFEASGTYRVIGSFDDFVQAFKTGEVGGEFLQEVHIQIEIPRADGEPTIIEGVFQGLSPTINPLRIIYYDYGHSGSVSKVQNPTISILQKVDPSTDSRGSRRGKSIEGARTLSPASSLGARFPKPEEVISSIRRALSDKQLVRDGIELVEVSTGDGKQGFVVHDRNGRHEVRYVETPEQSDPMSTPYWLVEHKGDYRNDAEVLWTSKFGEGAIFIYNQSDAAKRSLVDFLTLTAERSESTGPNASYLRQAHNHPLLTDIQIMDNQLVFVADDGAAQDIRWGTDAPPIVMSDHGIEEYRIVQRFLEDNLDLEALLQYLKSSHISQVSSNRFDFLVQTSALFNRRTELHVRVTSTIDGPLNIYDPLLPPNPESGQITISWHDETNGLQTKFSDIKSKKHTFSYNDNPRAFEQIVQILWLRRMFTYAIDSPDFIAGLVNQDFVRVTLLPATLGQAADVHSTWQLSQTLLPGMDPIVVRFGCSGSCDVSPVNRIEVDFHSADVDNRSRPQTYFLGSQHGALANTFARRIGSNAREVELIAAPDHSVSPEPVGVSGGVPLVAQALSIVDNENQLTASGGAEITAVQAERLAYAFLDKFMKVVESGGDGTAQWDLLGPFLDFLRKHRGQFTESFNWQLFLQHFNSRLMELISSAETYQRTVVVSDPGSTAQTRNYERPVRADAISLIGHLVHAASVDKSLLMEAIPLFDEAASGVAEGLFHDHEDVRIATRWTLRSIQEPDRNGKVWVDLQADIVARLMGSLIGPHLSQEPITSVGIVHAAIDSYSYRIPAAVNETFLQRLALIGAQWTVARLANEALGIAEELQLPSIVNIVAELNAAIQARPTAPDSIDVLTSAEGRRAVAYTMGRRYVEAAKLAGVSDEEIIRAIDRVSNHSLQEVRESAEWLREELQRWERLQQPISVLELGDSESRLRTSGINTVLDLITIQFGKKSTDITSDVALMREIRASLNAYGFDFLRSDGSLESSVHRVGSRKGGIRPLSLTTGARNSVRTDDEGFLNEREEYLKHVKIGPEHDLKLQANYVGGPIAFPEELYLQRHTKPYPIDMTHRPDYKPHVIGFFGKDNFLKTPTNKSTDLHDGIDIHAPAGTDVHAIEDGVVVFVSRPLSLKDLDPREKRDKAGVYVYSESSKMLIAYGHLDAVSVPPEIFNQFRWDPNSKVRVKAGQFLGKIAHWPSEEGHKNLIRPIADDVKEVYEDGDHLYDHLELKVWYLPEGKQALKVRDSLKHILVRSGLPIPHSRDGMRLAITYGRSIWRWIIVKIDSFLADTITGRQISKYSIRSLWSEGQFKWYRMHDEDHQNRHIKVNPLVLLGPPLYEIPKGSRGGDKGMSPELATESQNPSLALGTRSYSNNLVINGLKRLMRGLKRWYCTIHSTVNMLEVALPMSQVQTMRQAEDYLNRVKHAYVDALSEHAQSKGLGVDTRAPDIESQWTVEYSTWNEMTPEDFGGYEDKRVLIMAHIYFWDRTTKETIAHIGERNIYIYSTEDGYKAVILLDTFDVYQEGQGIASGIYDAERRFFSKYFPGAAIFARLSHKKTRHLFQKEYGGEYLDRQFMIFPLFWDLKRHYRYLGRVPSADEGRNTVESINPIPSPANLKLFLEKTILKLKSKKARDTTEALRDLTSIQPGIATAEIATQTSVIEALIPYSKGKYAEDVMKILSRIDPTAFLEKQKSRIIPYAQERIDPAKDKDGNEMSRQLLKHLGVKDPSQGKIEGSRLIVPKEAEYSSDGISSIRPVSQNALRTLFIFSSLGLRFKGLSLKEIWVASSASVADDNQINQALSSGLDVRTSIALPDIRPLDRARRVTGNGQFERQFGKHLMGVESQHLVIGLGLSVGGVTDLTKQLAQKILATTPQHPVRVSFVDFQNNLPQIRSRYRDADQFAVVDLQGFFESLDNSGREELVDSSPLAVTEGEVGKVINMAKTLMFLITLLTSNIKVRVDAIRFLEENHLIVNELFGYGLMSSKEKEDFVMAIANFKNKPGQLKLIMRHAVYPKLLPADARQHFLSTLETNWTT
jgi:murein DD-endopeptidase MepM/ murein hydrolase activator NlpD